MGDELGYWQWRDQLLKHPDGRAKGGDPCVKCGKPVPSNAHWVNRDRHVCSPHCNSNLSRQFNRRLQRGVEMPIPRPAPMADPRRTVGPRVFGMVEPGGEEDLPYEWEGFCPLDGDVVERHGAATVYTWVRPDQFPVVPEYAPHGFHVAVHESGHVFVYAATEHGHSRRVVLGQHLPDGERANSEEFEYRGRRLRWVHESIRDITLEGREYTWEATVCVPVGAPHGSAMWSPAYAEHSRVRKRISSSAARHERRVRVEAATTERFDPQDVYERDNWLCSLCGFPVDRELAWPDPLCASLDHVVPLAAGGEHSRANTQLAHWICNVRKGARTE